MNLQGDSRYHALDSMRATMMLLGIYLHVVVGYSGNGHWPFIDKHPTHVLDFTLGIIHTFRMPAFFAMAGFFGALLWNRRGPASFIANRTRRILLPFALFWSFMFPLVVAIVITLQSGADKIWPAFASGAILGKLHPLHMWFLEYLLMLYALGAVVAWLSGRLPGPVHQQIHAAYRWSLERWYAPALFAIFSWPSLIAMHGNLKDCDGFMPEPLILSAYIGPFGFGWLLYHSRDLLPRFQRHIGLYLALAVPAFLVYGLVPDTAHPFIKAAGNVLLCWLLTFASIGLFLRYCGAESAAWRYMSDASYWMFLMHMPVVIGMQVALIPLALPALAKIPIALALSVLVLVPSYDLLVRPTWLGALMNGRRYARGTPKTKEAAYAAAPSVS